MGAYIDQVVCSWERYYIDEEKLAAILKEKGKLFGEDVYDLMQEAYDVEWITNIDVDIPKDQATLEVYDEDDNLIWDNIKND